MAFSQNSLRIPASIEHMRAAVLFVSEAAEELGMHAEGIHHCQIAVEEVVTNIIQHGYTTPIDSDNVIDIEVRHTHADFVITIFDDAPPYDPTKRRDPNPAALLEDRKNGGWGVYFVKQYMDSVTYQRVNNRNRLMLTKRLR